MNRLTSARFARWTTIPAVLLVSVSFALGDPPATSAPGEPEAPKEARAKPREKEPEHVMAGSVVDADGEPVGGAKVAVASTESGYISISGVGSEMYFFPFAPEERAFLIFRKLNSKQAGEAETDAEGRFAIKGLKYESYRLVAYQAEKGWAMVEKVDFGKLSGSVEVKLAPPAFIEGSISGLPRQRASLFGAPSDGFNLAAEGLPDQISFYQTLVLDENSHFRVGPLPKAERWILSRETNVSRQGYYAVLLEVPVRAPLGQTVKLDVDLDHGSLVGGEVHGPKGEALSGVSVVVAGEGDSAWKIGAVTDAEGKYEIKGVPDGEYSLEAKRWTKRTKPG